MPGDSSCKHLLTKMQLLMPRASQIGVLVAAESHTGVASIRLFPPSQAGLLARRLSEQDTSTSMYNQVGRGASRPPRGPPGQDAGHALKRARPAPRSRCRKSWTTSARAGRYLPSVR